MGCVNSKDINDTHPNIFQVANVNDSGVTISPGKLQVTDSELVLYQRGKQPVRWPLRSLRKYGFDSEVFSFECGRRCATGEGIYAFKTRKAEQLFNLMQLKICGNENGRINSTERCFSIPQPDSSAMPQMVNRRQESRPGSCVGLQVQASPSPPPVDSAREPNNNLRLQEQMYINLIPARNERVLDVRNYQNVDLTNTETTTENNETEVEPSHVYMNVDAIELNAKDTIIHHEQIELPELLEDHCYANINTKDAEDCELSVPPTPTVANINYAALDLSTVSNSTNHTELIPESPLEPKKGYATIDFQKTNALSQSINPNIDIEEGSRKTRHNSTISDITTRHSNSLSD